MEIMLQHSCSHLGKPHEAGEGLTHASRGLCHGYHSYRPTLWPGHTASSLYVYKLYFFCSTIEFGVVPDTGTCPLGNTTPLDNTIALSRDINVYTGAAPHHGPVP